MKRCPKHPYAGWHAWHKNCPSTPPGTAGFERPGDFICNERGCFWTGSKNPQTKLSMRPVTIKAGRKEYVDL